MATIDDSQRCSWCHSDDLYRAYHDDEWGQPSRDPHHLFEMLNLEGQQAGLSWITILRKREGYRRAFCDFDPVRIAQFDDSDVERLVLDASIIRHRGKIEAIIGNARAWLAMQESGTDPVEFLWGFVGGESKINRPTELSEVPSQTDESKAMSKALKKAGFRFVGPTTCYAFMQAAGLVNDHLCGCYQHPDNRI
jgi:DNA-3-methyladenine glycosylase I